MPLRDTFKEFLSWSAIDYLTEGLFNNAKLQLNNYRITIILQDDLSQWKGCSNYS